MYDVLVTRLREYEESGLSPVSPYEAGEIADAIEELTAIREEQKAQIIATAAEIEEQKLRWIPVTERLPLRGDAVLCVGDNGIGIADFVCGDKWCALPWFYVDGEQETNVTHWMPLPEPPKEET